MGLWPDLEAEAFTLAPWVRANQRPSAEPPCGARHSRGRPREVSMPPWACPLVAKRPGNCHRDPGRAHRRAPGPRQGVRIQRLILAAGAGRRFGADKRRARSSGETLLEATLSVLCPADPCPSSCSAPERAAPAAFQDQVRVIPPALGRGARPLPCRRREGLGCRSGPLASYRPRRYALPSTGDPEGPEHACADAQTAPGPLPTDRP